MKDNLSPAKGLVNGLILALLFWMAAYASYKYFFDC